MNARQRRKMRRAAGWPLTVQSYQPDLCVGLYHDRFGLELILSDLELVATPIAQLGRLSIIAQLRAGLRRSIHKDNGEIG